MRHPRINLYHVYRWQLLLKEYGSAIIYTNIIDNSTVADTISRLDYNLALNRYADDKDVSKEKSGINFLH